MPQPHPDGCRCNECQRRGGHNGASRRVAAVALVSAAGAPVTPRKRFALECGACGCDALACVGPYTDQDSPGGDIGLRWVFTCTRCGESLRIYQTSPEWRARREERARAVFVLQQAANQARASGCTCPLISAAGELVTEHLEGCPAKGATS